MYQSVLPGSQAKKDGRSPGSLRVDVVADFVCPWCYLGKRRLDAALGAVRGPRSVHWFPFQLNPEMPAEGMPLDDYLASRFGSADTVKPGLAALEQAGRGEGLDFRFDRIQRIPNTLDAHRLMYLAETEGADTAALAESLMARLFTSGEDIGSRDVLLAAGQSQGLQATAIHAALDDDLSKQIVLNQETQMKKSGVAGAPVFLINQRLFVSGAQDTDTLVGLFDRAMFGDDQAQPDHAMLH